MKKSEIRSALDALKTIKMQEVSNTDLRASLVRAHFVLLGEMNKLDAVMKDIHTVHLGAYEAEIGEIVPLEQEMMNPSTTSDRRLEIAKELRSHEGLQAAIKLFNAEAEKIGEEEVEIPAIDTTTFLAEATAMGLDFDILEKLYPMLTGE